MSDRDPDAAIVETPSPMRIPIFRAMWTASLISNLGAVMQTVGASWMMASLTDSPQLIALVQSSTALPIVFLSLWAGAVADNLDRRRIMLSAQLLMLAVSIALTIYAFNGWLTPWLLLAFTFLVGCGTALAAPAWHASVGDMVPRKALPAAVALNSMAFNLARSAGPAVGGAIVAVAGTSAAFAANAFSYLGLILVLARWRPNLPERALPRERIGLAMAAGLRYVAMSPPLRAVIVRSAMFTFAASAVPALMPVVARDLLSGGPLVYGVLLGAFGIGAVCAAFISGRLRAHMPNQRIVQIASLAVAIGATGAGLSTSLPLTIAALLIAGLGWVLALSTLNATVQLSTPRWVVARSLSIYQMVAFTGMAVGSWVFGSVAERHGLSVALLTVAAIQLLGMALSQRISLPETGNLNLAPGQWKEPTPTLPIESRSGPIVVTIEYRIASENILEFLRAMAERRRIRRRDGARHWTLLRDLEDTELWVERYHVATWLEYVRHNRRRTQDDSANGARIRSLHMGPADPQVHRMIERQTGSVPSALERDRDEVAGPLSDPTHYT